MASKKSTKQQSKASFVRALPAGLSAAEVVEKAKSAGIALDVGYVYNIRSTAKSSSKARRGGEASSGHAKAASAKTNGTSAKRATNSSSVEALLKAVGAELGLASAIRILEAERARVHAVLGK